MCEQAIGVVSALRNMGLQCHMVTGDNWRTARIVAAQLGIINVQAEVLPAGKADAVCFSCLIISATFLQYAALMPPAVLPLAWASSMSRLKCCPREKPDVMCISSEYNSQTLNQGQSGMCQNVPETERAASV